MLKEFLPRSPDARRLCLGGFSGVPLRKISGQLERIVALVELPLKQPEGFLWRSSDPRDVPWPTFPPFQWRFFGSIIPGGGPQAVSSKIERKLIFFLHVGIQIKGSNQLALFPTSSFRLLPSDASENC